MSNTFNYTPAQIADVAQALAKTGAKLASVVTKFGPADFKAGRGNTVFLNVPGALTAHGRTLDDVTNQIVMDSLAESQEPVKLDTHAYSAVGLSEYDLSLGITDFSKQVLLPQVDAVVDKIETTIETVLAGVEATASTGYNAASPVALFSEGRRALRARGVDVTGDMVALVGSQIVDDLLDSGALDFKNTGTADALRGGALGPIRGFETLETNRVAANEVIFMPRNAVYLAHRAPDVPLGAAFGANASGEGFTLRYLRDYDPTVTRERSLVSTFVGAGIMPLYKVERTADTGKQGDAAFAAGTAKVTEVPGGAVVKLSVA